MPVLQGILLGIGTVMTVFPTLSDLFSPKIVLQSSPFTLSRERRMMMLKLLLMMVFSCRKLPNSLSQDSIPIRVCPLCLTEFKI